MRIRAAEMKDVDAILAAGESMHGESRFRMYAFSRNRARKAIEETIQQSRAACILIAEPQHGVLAGMLACHVVEYFFADVRAAHDRVFYVLPEYRGSSAALKLLLAYRKWAVNRSAREVCINMSVDIRRDYFSRLMGKVGYRPCGENFFMSLGQRSEGTES